jgi:hypothetical protein
MKDDEVALVSFNSSNRVIVNEPLDSFVNSPSPGTPVTSMAFITHSLGRYEQSSTLSVKDALFWFTLSLLTIVYTALVTQYRNSGWSVGIVAAIVLQLFNITQFIPLKPGMTYILMRSVPLYRLVSKLSRLEDVRQGKIVLKVVSPLVILILYIILKGDTDKGTRYERLLSLVGMTVILGGLALLSKVE